MLIHVSPQLSGDNERSGDLGLLAWSESHKPNPASIRIGLEVLPKGRLTDLFGSEESRQGVGVGDSVSGIDWIADDVRDPVGLSG